MQAVDVTTRGVSRLTHAGFALYEIDLELRASERILVLGHNGAGKSTLLRLLSGLSRPDSGSIQWRVDGTALSKEKMWSRLGYCAQNLQLYSQLSVRENITLFFSLRSTADKVDAQIGAWGLKPHEDKRIAELSKGLQVRVALAVTFANDPSFVLLDEPTSSLDEEGAHRLTAVVESVCGHSSGALCVIASHDISRFANLCTRIIVLDQGRIAIDSKSLLGTLSSEEAKESVINRYRRTNR